MSDRQNENGRSSKRAWARDTKRALVKTARSQNGQTSKQALVKTAKRDLVKTAGCAAFATGQAAKKNTRPGITPAGVIELVAVAGVAPAAFPCPGYGKPR